MRTAWAAWTPRRTPAPPTHLWAERGSGSAEAIGDLALEALDPPWDNPGPDSSRPSLSDLPKVPTAAGHRRS